MKIEIHSDRAVLDVFETVRETNAQLWLFFPDSQMGVCYPVIVPFQQSGEENFWEAKVMEIMQLLSSYENQIADLERIKMRYLDLCRIAGGESKLFGLLMSKKILINDDTDAEHADTVSGYRSAFFNGRGQ